MSMPGLAAGVSPESRQGRFGRERVERLRGFDGHGRSSGQQGTLLSGTRRRASADLVDASGVCVPFGDEAGRGKPSSAMPMFPSSSAMIPAISETGRFCLALVGFMGTGKTTVGRELSALLGWEFVDLDIALAADYGQPGECFASEGENWFREREHNAFVDALAAPRPSVVALGGGALTHPRTLDLLLRSPDVLCMCLTADLDIIMRRVSDGAVSAARPLLPEPNSRKARAAQMLAHRSNAYSQFRQYDTSKLGPTETASKIAYESMAATGHARSLGEPTTSTAPWGAAATNL